MWLAKRGIVAKDIAGELAILVDTCCDTKPDVAAVHCEQKRIAEIRLYTL